jgi:SAM-dependent methyltransferase
MGVELHGEGPCPGCGGEGVPLTEYPRAGLERCDGCGLVFSELARDPRLRDRYESGEYADSHSGVFNEDRAFAFIARRRVEWLAGSVAPGRLVELGPGRGYFMRAAKAAGFDPLGVEASPELAARIASDFGLPVECGFIEELTLPQGEFDSFCMFHVLEHLSDPPRILSIARDLLQSRGHLVVEVPNIESAMAVRRGERWEAVQPRELHISHFSVRTLRETVERAGFEVTAIDTVSPSHFIPVWKRLLPRAAMGFAYRALSLRTLRSTHPSGFDNIRLLASPRA